MEKETFNAMLMVIGGTIGAGFLGIPYAIAKAGFLIGFIQLIGIGIITIVMSLYVAEIILRTRGKFQVVALADRYLGKWGKRIMAIAAFSGMYGALTAYGIGVGSAVSAILGGNPLIWSGVFLLIASVLIFKGLKIIEDVEMILVGIIVPFLFIICLSILPGVDLANLAEINWGNAFLPYGVILFACMSYSAIPEVAQVIRKKSDLNKAILLGGLIYIFVYIIFAITFVGNFGTTVAGVATLSLPGWIGTLGNLTSALTMGTVFLILGLVLKDNYIEAFHYNKYLAWVLACIIPFAIVFLIRPDFISVLSVVGIFAGGLIGIMLGLIVLKARKSGDRVPEFTVPGGAITVVITTLLFLIGISLEILFYFKII